MARCASCSGTSLRLRPAFARQAVAQDKAGHARAIEMPRHIHALEIQHLAQIAAARRQNHCRTVGPVGPEHIHHRNADLIDGAVAGRDVGRFVIGDAYRRQVQAFAARRRARPERDHILGIGGQHAIALHRRVRHGLC